MNASDVTPTDLRDFARSLGWQILPDGIVERLYVLAHPAFPRRQVVIPIDADAPDYAEASLRAMEKLADIHKLSLADAVSRARTVREDSMQLRITSARANDDGLPLSFASELLRGAEQMLLSSACTVLRPQIHHLRLHRSEATQLLGYAQLGQTQRGSFVVRVSCPVDAMPMPASFPHVGENTSFVRETMLVARTGVREIVRAIEADALDSFVGALKNAPAPVVSSNLCEALSRLHDEDIRNNIDLSFRWAVRLPLPNNVPSDEVLRIPSVYFDRIDEVRRELRSVERDRDDVFVGTVEQLNGEFDVEGRRAGEVIVALLLREGETLKARLTLGSDDYASAVEAHVNDRAFVRIAGRLRPGRQPRTLIDVTSFMLIPAPGRGGL
ncbi:hypothetical protein [Caballeronia humi]|uniref:Uncharacterized protein n=1 Tax=Caballeronia humi TaxID=326474 RepID=A0A158IL40_9BURK|nr:hypothetical protein [Caballeronia humi]SAL57207.1 hypothetical protein AWB65_05012 [Caballeronia humi]